MGIFDKGIQKTKQSFFQRLSRAVVGKSKVDDETLDAIEEALVASDMGVDTTLKIIDNLEDRVERDKYLSFEELVALLRDEIGFEAIKKAVASGDTPSSATNAPQRGGMCGRIPPKNIRSMWSYCRIVLAMK